MAVNRWFSVKGAIVSLVSLLLLSATAQADNKAVSSKPVLSDEAIELKQAVQKVRPKKHRKLLQSFYTLRNYQPTWKNYSQVSALLKNLRESDKEGLNPADYRLDEIKQASGLQQELILTDVLLSYAHDLRDGVHSPQQVDRRWHIRKPKFNLVGEVSKAVEYGRLRAFLKDLAPPHEEYAALRAQLREHRKVAKRGGWPDFPARGPRRLDPGDRHQQVESLRARLAVTDKAASSSADSQLYDDALVEAVKRFQRRHGLNDDGVVGGATRAALAVPIEQRIEQIIASMERWRWMPRELGSSYVIVDVPAYRLWFHQPGKKPLTMRTIVGDYKNQTPSFTQKMKYLVMNPNWYVPNSIASKELAPKISEDPDYVDRAGFKVYDKQSKQQIDPASVDWASLGTGSEFPYRIVQSSGNTNALGDIKFIFPNRHGIYLHDTSAPSLFRNDKRALSHGCIRIEKPLELAARILGTSSPDEIASMIQSSSHNRHVNLKGEIPVYLVYMTAWSEGKGDISFFNDIYKRDRRLLAAK
ncbi:L,D-transpeptidase family protein [Solemya velum gill symbiont]|nr:L,D-transpeptidase family protein [Solemya velum gill symbiont]